MWNKRALVRQGVHYVTFEDCTQWRAVTRQGPVLNTKQQARNGCRDDEFEDRETGDEPSSERHISSYCQCAVAAGNQKYVGEEGVWQSWNLWNILNAGGSMTFLSPWSGVFYDKNITEGIRIGRILHFSLWHIRNLLLTLAFAMFLVDIDSALSYMYMWEVLPTFRRHVFPLSSGFVYFLSLSSTFISFHIYFSRPFFHLFSLFFILSFFVILEIKDAICLI